MVVISVSNLKKSYPTKEIFDNVSFKIEKGEKVGLIGNNGSGKTTLFNVITGRDKKDSGEIYIPNEVKVGYLTQQLSLDSKKTIYQYCLAVFDNLISLEKEILDLTEKMSDPSLSEKELNKLMEVYAQKHQEFEDKNGYSYKSEITGTLIGMGFEPDDFDKEISILSGGQKARVELALLLLQKPDLILLDEPTNHLDIKAINFLENFVKNFSGSALIISHDRYFLDATIDKVYHLENNKLKTYKGNYTEFISQRKKELKVLKHTYKSQQKEIKRQEEIIERLKNQGGSLRKRGIAQSRSRQKLLDKMERVDKPFEESDSMNLKFTPRIQSGEDVLQVKDLKKSFDGKEIFKNISFSQYKKDRTAIIGENGIGKTTLFKIIMGELKADEGSLKLGSSVNIGYFDQEQKSLNTSNTIFEEISKAYPKLTNYQIRSYLAKFMFYADDVYRLINELSGGERARISLLKLMLSDCNFILMDEPTNHLDIDSKEILEDAILDYEGSVLIISHDRYFLNKVAVKILEMRNDGMDEYLGNYDYYVKKIKEKNQDEENFPTVSQTKLKKDQKKQKMAQKEIRKAKNKLKAIEESLEKIEEEINDLTMLTVKEDFYKDQDFVVETFDKLKSLEEKKQELSDTWLEMSLSLEES
ncbi:MAG: ABC-F family ATP-binding cassette domain-containing protein [Peptoniphilaceae bacterium]|nr:ABC-F family ATP-binding cassette domain-containing protein [Peptoniphilaceae bacterium]MDY6018237.1 ABC-F family ATP-binding cassette domain-containing protein [Anaerococcus sp.]